MRPLINSLRLFKANANEQREALNNNNILIINNDKKNNYDVLRKSVRFFCTKSK